MNKAVYASFVNMIKSHCCNLKATDNLVYMHANNLVSPFKLCDLFINT